MTISLSLSYELVYSLMNRFDELLNRSPFQRQDPASLDREKINLDDKRRVKDIELAFTEETESIFNRSPFR